MIGRRDARHLRRRTGRMTAMVVVAIVVLGLASGLALVRVASRSTDINVTVLVGGAPRFTKVATPATVASALKAAAVVPRPGQLLSLVSHTVLDAAAKPATLLLNGQPARPDAQVLEGFTVGVVEPPDATEETVEGGDAVPAPPEPDVINALWHPGRPGRGTTQKGAVSGEVLTQREVVPPVPPAPVTEKLVALTFDDGPWPTTPEILRILREKNVKATFCVITRQLKGGGLDLAKTALAEGHHLCNHTVDHDQKLPSKGQDVVDQEIIGGNAQLQERLGIKPTYYRPPGGSLGPNVIATAKAQGQQVLMWTVDTKDYTKPPADAIINTVMAQVRPGGVVLMHDGGGDRSATVAALPVVIDRLRADGYELVLPDAVAPVPAAPGTVSPPA